MLTKEDKRRDAYYRRTYGITLAQYDELLAKQHNRCAVCKSHQGDLRTRLAVDHDHKTREIFGLLCFRCNHILIGRIRDGSLFAAAARYLKQGTGWFTPEKKPRRRRKRRH